MLHVLRYQIGCSVRGREGGRREATELLNTLSPSQIIPFPTVAAVQVIVIVRGELGRSGEETNKEL